MGDLTENFSRREFACSGVIKNTGCGCDGFIAVDYELVKILQHLRDEAGTAVKINSAYRCPTRNKQVGGASNSMHIKGLAADIWVGTEGAGPDPDWTPEHVEAWLRHHYPHVSSGLYDTFLHLDTRPDGPAQWDSRKRNAGKKIPKYKTSIPTDGKHTPHVSLASLDERVTALEARCP